MAKGPAPTFFCKRGHDKRVVGKHGRNCAECTRLWLRAKYRSRVLTNTHTEQEYWNKVLRFAGLGHDIAHPRWLRYQHELGDERI